ncbi:MAG: S8 family serine peptidase, partial [bacterium]|nr:S8 family serine peptidase [bacterium]
MDRLNLARVPTRGAASTVIAVLDTGVDDTAPQLAGAIVAGWDMVLDRADMLDEHGHGTMLAHAAAGRPRGTNTVASPCQACSIMPIRVSTGSDTGDFTALDDRLARGLRWARDHGAAIAVIGLAADEHPALTSTAVEEVVRDGLVVIAPAGNQGAAIAGFPARLEGVISVGASRGSEDVALPQANGPFGVDVWAPADTDFLPVAGGATRRGGGSSIAAAYTAGVAGLLRTLHPTLSPAAVRSLLMSTAAPLEPAGSKQRVPGGRIDAAAAISKIYPAPSTDRIADLAVPFAELLPRKPKPGQTGRVRIRVQNMGTLSIDIDDAVLRLWRGTRAEWFNPGTGVLPPGESKWFELPYLASSTPGADPLIVEVTEKPGHIIGGPGIATVLGNDARRVLSYEIAEPTWQELVAVVPAMALSERSSDVEIATTDTKNIALMDLREELTRPPDPDRTTIRVTYANTGNTDLIAGVDASVAGSVVARMAAEAWPPGSQRSFRITLERAQLPATQNWIVALRPTITDDDPNDDSFDVKLPSRYTPGFRLAYGDFSGNDLIFDAPFRVNSNRRVIPFLSFVPEWGDSRDVVMSYSVYANDGHINLVSGFDPDVIQNHWQTNGSLVFMSTRQRNRRGERIVGLPNNSGRTRRSSWSPEVVDEDGRVHTNRYFGTASVTRRHGAFHRVLRVPWDAATHDFPNRRRQPTAMFFLTQYTVLKHGFFGGSTEHYWAVLRVILDTLPEATGAFQGRYYDAHFHTIAEGSEGILTGGIAP